MNPYKVILWGDTVFYDVYRHYFEIEVLKGNMRIVAIVPNDLCGMKCIDGIPLIMKDELRQVEFDYLINMNRGVEDEMNVLQLLGISKNEVIPIWTFTQPCFDLERWIQVKESRVSIIASHCWGGFLYNTLGLEFLSPFINLFMEVGDFITLAGDLREYMDLPLEYIGDGVDTNTKKVYPIGQLGDVKINFNHYKNFEEARKCWERRKKKINYDNLLFEISTDNPNYLERFLELPYENKICFTTLPYEDKNVISMHGNPCMARCFHVAWSYANKSASKDNSEYKEYDMLKLLNHEPDYRRSC